MFALSRCPRLQRTLVSDFGSRAATGDLFHIRTGSVRSNDGGATWRNACFLVAAQRFARSQPACIIPKPRTSLTVILHSTGKPGWALRKLQMLATTGSWFGRISGPATNVHDDWITGRFGVTWGENPLNMTVADQDANLAYGTDLGRTMRTSDGGATWDGVYSRKVDDAGWSTVGPDVTTNYGVHFDPFDPKRIFITYTDIGLFRSEDGGVSWTSATMGVPRSGRTRRTGWSSIRKSRAGCGA